MPRPRIAFAMVNDQYLHLLFTPETMARLESIGDIVDRSAITDFDDDWARTVLARTEVLVTGWGSPRLTRSAVAAAPALKLVAHAGGPVRRLLDAEVWEKGVRVVNAAEANGRPVAAYTLAWIILAAKGAPKAVNELRHLQGGYRVFPSMDLRVGTVGTVVGVVGASRVGRQVIELLKLFPFQVLVSDPTLTAAEADALGVELVRLDELCARSDIVTLHAPALPSTIGMISDDQLEAMRPGATLINTARGVLVDMDAVRDHVRSGRITAILDMTDPEPLPTGDELYVLPNAIVTPHLAGAAGNELRLLGEAVVAEIERFAAGEPLRCEVSVAALESGA